jgi:hypothetical protein
MGLALWVWAGRSVAGVLLEEVALAAAITALWKLFDLRWILNLDDLFFYVLLEDVPSVQASPTLVSTMAILSEVATDTCFLEQSLWIRNLNTAALGQRSSSSLRISLLDVLVSSSWCPPLSFYLLLISLDLWLLKSLLILDIQILLNDICRIYIQLFAHNNWSSTIYFLQETPYLVVNASVMLI